MHTLKPIIEYLAQQARAKPDMPQVYTLAGGLRIEVLINKEHTHLQLSHEDVFPTEIEYHSILNHWPESFDRPRPQAVAHSGRKYLTAYWTSLPSAA